ncbi:MAG: hypothetical protein B0D92_00325 [Spirochaeta sp. LUC14_002_19_P3]|nr:MAG: hypothetical protein B0D92_00325 [Spirochaeta sp. LUC14_002_19_P3]
MTTEFIHAESSRQAEAAAKEGFVFLAGGTELNNAYCRKWKNPAEKVISLRPLKLEGIAVQGKSIRIGAMSTLQSIADSALLPKALRTAAGFIPSRPIRNMATIGGNIGANRSDSALIPVLLALDARIISANAQEMPLESWLASPCGLITEILIPPLEGCCMAVKESRSFAALPVVCAALRLAAKGGKLSQAAVYAGCVAPHVVRLKNVEAAILGGADVEAAVKAAISPQGDVLGGAEYKRYINAVKIADTVKLCAAEVLE